MKRKILALIAIIIILIIGAISALFYVKQGINKPRNAGDAHTMTFEVKQGQGVKNIGDNLEKDGIITKSDFFKIYLWETKAGSKLQAGTYQISPSMTIPQIVGIFTHGEAGLKSNEARVVITEGSSNQDILDKMKEAGVISSDANFKDIKIDASKYDFLADKPDDADLEGYLFPDTYNFFKGSSLEDVTAKMLENFGGKLTPQMRQDIVKQNKSLYEILTLASIVEKESPDKADMPTIAGVFYNRLEAGMPLQSDATINYLTKAGNPTPTSEDLEIDSPYNTYKNKGLPPSPICNPGIEAIKAATYPAKTDYMYFLMTQDGNKRTIFSKTYEEHLQNKAKYLK